VEWSRELFDYSLPLGLF